PGMLHARMLRSPYAHAKIKSIDTSAAEKTPGVKAIYKQPSLFDEEGKLKPNAELYYAGDEILGLAADTEEHAADALHAIKIEYEVLDFFVKEEDALAKPDKKTLAGRGNVSIGGESTTGDVAKAFSDPNAVVVEGVYGV